MGDQLLHVAAIMTRQQAMQPFLTHFSDCRSGWLLAMPLKMQEWGLRQ
jgi:hypothetical protein